MVAILEIGAFIASLLVGRIGDVIGRRRTILYGSMVFFVGGTFQSFANGMPMMLVGRILAGFGVGALSTIVPVYQSEISPPHNRGKLACIEFTGNITGYAASVWVGYFSSYIGGDFAWRLPLLLQIVLGALLGFGSLIICESPRYVCLLYFTELLPNVILVGYLITTMMKKALWSSRTSTAVETYTMKKHDRNIGRSR